jgi:hypothetical protein
MLSLKRNNKAAITLIGVIELLIMLTCLLAIVLQLSIDKLGFDFVVGIISVGGLGIVFSSLLMRYFIQKVK